MQPAQPIERDIIHLTPPVAAPPLHLVAPEPPQIAPHRDALLLSPDTLKDYQQTAELAREAALHQLEAAEIELEQALASLAGQGSDVDNDRASDELTARLSDIRSMQQQARSAPLTALGAITRALPQILSGTASGVTQAVQSASVEKHTLMAEITLEAIQHYSVQQIGALTADHFAMMDDAQLQALRGRIIDHSAAIGARSADKIDARAQTMRDNGQDPDALIRQKQQWMRDLQAANAKGDTVAAADAAHKLAIAGGDPQDIADARTLATTARMERFRSENPQASKDQHAAFEKQAEAEVSSNDARSRKYVEQLVEGEHMQQAFQQSALKREESLQNGGVSTTEVRAVADFKDKMHIEMQGGFSLADIPMDEIGQLGSPKTPTKPAEVAAKGQGGDAPPRS